MKTILVPLDGSALAKRVLPYARLLARTIAEEVDWRRADLIVMATHAYSGLS